MTVSLLAGLNNFAGSNGSNGAKPAEGIEGLFAMILQNASAEEGDNLLDVLDAAEEGGVLSAIKAILAGDDFVEGFEAISTEVETGKITPEEGMEKLLAMMGDVDVAEELFANIKFDESGELVVDEAKVDSAAKVFEGSEDVDATVKKLIERSVNEIEAEFEDIRPEMADVELEEVDEKTDDNVRVREVMNARDAEKIFSEMPNVYSEARIVDRIFMGEDLVSDVVGAVAPNAVIAKSNVIGDGNAKVEQAEVKPVTVEVGTRLFEVVKETAAADRQVLMVKNEVVATEAEDVATLEDVAVEETVKPINARADGFERSEPLMKIKPAVVEAQKISEASELAQAVKPVMSTAEAGMMAADGVDADLFQQTVNNVSGNAKDSPFGHGLLQRAEVGKQVAVQFKAMNAKGGGEIKLQLNPAELGEVDIHLDISDGRVKGTVTVQQPEVMEQLARELRHLQQGLADAGLELADDGISFFTQDQRREEGGDGKGQQFAEEGVEGIENGSDTEVANDGWVSPDRLVDLKA